MKKFRNVLLFLLCGAMFITFACGSGEEEENVDLSTVEFTKVTVKEMNKALTDNAAAAKDEYNKKYLEVTGILGTIDSDLKYISLDEGDFDLQGIHCTIKNDEQKEIVKKLKKGQSLTIKGKITDVGEVLGYYMDIIEIVQE